MATLRADEERRERLPRTTTFGTALNRTEADELLRFARQVDMSPSALLRESVLRVIEEEKRIRRLN